MTTCVVCGQTFSHMARRTYGVPVCSYACEDSPRGERLAREFDAYLQGVRGIVARWRDADRVEVTA